MPTIQQICTRAAQALGYKGRVAGEVLLANEATDALNAFNALLDSWSGENLASFANVTVSHTLVAGTQSYTIGSGGTISATRPDNIVQAFIRDTSSLDYPLRVIPQDIWNNIGDKTITSQIPTSLFYDPQYPLGIIYLFPIPLLAYTLRFTAIIQQSTFSSTGQSISVPPGYERAYVMNLALEMISAGFPCMLKDRDYARLVENASEAKANIKRKNIKEVIAPMDEAMVAQSYATYNIYSDDQPRG